jgi:polyhydroxyalkanoate synthesis repressor PhaR
MPAERIIKKYANRRLYDAAASRHVTLEDLRKLIVQGENLKVVDDKPVAAARHFIKVEA